MDEVFGEGNFVSTVVWQKIFAPKNTARFVSENHDFVLWYAKSKDRFTSRLLPRTAEADARYANPDEDHRGPWTSDNLTARNPYSKGTYPITCPGGRVISGPPPGTYWRFSEERLRKLDEDDRIWWGAKGNNMPRLKRFLAEVKKGVVPQTLWLHTDVGNTQEAKKELVSTLQFERSEDVFNTVKPSRLIRRILQIATDPDSIVLDSFAGSGTTAHAVLAQNREDGGNRRFILIECEGYADTITAERVRRVIKGVPSAKDKSLKTGLGGAFSYFELGHPMRQESLLDGSHLPSWEKLAGYIFFTATGQEFDPAEINRETGLIGRTRSHDVFLLYEPDVEKLKNLALTLSGARTLPTGTRRRLVFAPAKYLDPEFLQEYRIDFQQLPFQIYEATRRMGR